MEIEVEVEDITTVKKRLRVEVPAQVALQEFNRVATEYRKRARLPGFRPGKAPLELVKRRFQKDIRDDVLQRLIPDSYDQAVREKGLRPLGEPRLENISFEEGQKLKYETQFEIRPEFTLPAYSGLEVRVESHAITDETIDRELERVREAHSRLRSVEDRPIQDGDYAVIDMKGEYLEEGEPHGHGHGSLDDENVTIRVGDTHTHAAFSSALRGMNVGEQKTFEVDYPADYPEKKLAGHRVSFTIRVTETKQKELPELNDELAKDLGQETLHELRQKIRQDLAASQERNREADLRKKLVEQLVGAVSFDVPDTLVEDRIDERIRELAYGFAAQGLDPAKANVDWLKVRKDLRPQAEKDVRTTFLLTEIGRAEQIQVSKEELEQEIDRIADSSNQPKEKVRQYFEKNNRLEDLRSQVLRRRALDLVQQRAKVR